jgi:hypothetical protein
MPTGDLEEMARMAGQVLKLAGLRDRADGDGLGRAGGFQVWAHDGQVVVDWMPVSELFDEAQQGYRHPAHPLAAAAADHVVKQGEEIALQLGRRLIACQRAQAIPNTWPGIGP